MNIEVYIEAETLSDEEVREFSNNLERILPNLVQLAGFRPEIANINVQVVATVIESLSKK